MFPGSFSVGVTMGNCFGALQVFGFCPSGRLSSLRHSPLAK